MISNVENLSQKTKRKSVPINNQSTRENTRMQRPCLADWLMSVIFLGGECVVRTGKERKAVVCTSAQSSGFLHLASSRRQGQRPRAWTSQPVKHMGVAHYVLEVLKYCVSPYRTGDCCFCFILKPWLCLGGGTAHLLVLGSAAHKSDITNAIHYQLMSLSYRFFEQFLFLLHRAKQTYSRVATALPTQSKSLKKFKRKEKERNHVWRNYCY